MKDLLIGLAIGGVVVGYATSQLNSTAAPLQIPNEIGRYQIVNGTPQYSMNIMLIDTVTGETWIKCSSPETDDLWCSVQRSDGQTSPKKK